MEQAGEWLRKLDNRCITQAIHKLTCPAIASERRRKGQSAACSRCRVSEWLQRSIRRAAMKSETLHHNNKKQTHEFWLWSRLRKTNQGRQSLADSAKSECRQIGRASCRERV